MSPASYKPDKNMLKQLADEKIEPFHYAKTMARLRDEQSRSNPLMKVAKKSAVFAGTVVVLFLAMLLIPASYSVNVGSIVKAEFPFDEALSPEAIVKAASGIDGIVNRNLSIENDNAVLTLAFQEKSARQAKSEVLKAIGPLFPDNDGLLVTSENITKLMGGNALAAVTGGRVEIGIDALSEGEMRAQIISQLEAQGLIVRNVSVQKDESVDGEMKIEVRVEAETPEGFEGEMPMRLEHIMPSKGNDEERVIITRREVRDLDEDK